MSEMPDPKPWEFRDLTDLRRAQLLATVRGAIRNTNDMETEAWYDFLQLEREGLVIIEWNNEVQANIVRINPAA